MELAHFFSQCTLDDIFHMGGLFTGRVCIGQA